MVQYEGQITKDGELLVNLSGNFVPLHEFLQAAELTPPRKQRQSGHARQRVRVRGLAAAK